MVMLLLKVYIEVVNLHTCCIYKSTHTFIFLVYSKLIKYCKNDIYFLN